MSASLPNALYIGLARSGSTWLSEVLRHHPDIYVPEVKDIYFFDREYARGIDWYRQFFAAGATSPVRIEFSHDYLHVPFVPRRIRRTLGEPRLLVTLREPVSWVVSNYQNMRRNGVSSSEMGWVMSQHMGLVASGLYSSYVRSYLAEFSREEISIFLFDDLVDDPDSFHRSVLAALGLSMTSIPDEVAGVVNAAAEARWGGAARAIRAGGTVARRLGRPELVGKAKRSTALRRVLYREVGNDVTADDEIREGLRAFFRDDVHRLGDLIDIDVVSRWGY